ncbi:MAG TPA: hypothetical protein VGM29_00540 [Polyangiaceae bacterium]|jgi:hypothetical protein
MIPELQSGVRNGVAFVALESGSTWHWGWALAHQLGFQDCVIVQQLEEPPAEFERRTQRALRGISTGGGRLGVAVLCTRAELSAKLVTGRYLLARLMLGYVAANCASLVLTAPDTIGGMRGHLSALAEALRENVSPLVPIKVELFAQAS